MVAAAGSVVIALLDALFGLPDEASPLLWRLFAAASAGVVGLLGGLAKA